MGVSQGVARGDMRQETALTTAGATRSMTSGTDVLERHRALHFDGSRYWTISAAKRASQSVDKSASRQDWSRSPFDSSASQVEQLRGRSVTANDESSRQSAKASLSADQALFKARSVRRGTSDDETVTMEDRDTAVVTSTPRRSPSTLNSRKSAPAAQNRAGPAASISRSTATAASTDSVWNDVEHHTLVNFEQLDSEVAIRRQSSPRQSSKQDNAWIAWKEHQRDVTAAASRESTGSPPQEMSHHLARRGRRMDSTAAPLIILSDSKDDICCTSPGDHADYLAVDQHTENPFPVRHSRPAARQTSGTSLMNRSSATSVKFTDSRQTALRQSPTRQARHRQEILLQGAWKERHAAATSRKRQSTEQAGHVTAMDTESSDGEIEERRGRTGQATDSRSSRHSAGLIARARGSDNDRDHTRSRRQLSSLQRERHSSQERTTSLDLPQRHGERHSRHHEVRHRLSGNKRQDDVGLSPEGHRRDRRETVQVDSDSGSASPDHSTFPSTSGLGQSDHGANRARSSSASEDHAVRNLGAQLMEFFRLRTSPKSGSPRDRDGHQERHSRQPLHGMRNLDSNCSDEQGRQVDEVGTRRRDRCWQPSCARLESGDERQSRRGGHGSDNDGRGSYSSPRRRESDG